LAYIKVKIKIEAAPFLLFEIVIVLPLKSQNPSYDEASQRTQIGLQQEKVIQGIIKRYLKTRGFFVFSWSLSKIQN